MIQICLLSFISGFGIRISNFFNEEGLLDLMSMSRARVRHIFSAKGAAFTSSLGRRPRIRGIRNPPALKARFTWPSSGIIIRSMPQSLSKVILHKKISSKWIKTIDTRYRGFLWQRGYGAFSVSPSQLDAVLQYVETQQEHHRTRTFQEEFRDLLRRHGVNFDERYVWD